VVTAAPRTAAIVNLGCKVNQSEMEGAARLLRERGVRLVEASSPADLVLVNTCTVTAVADEKSRAAVRRARRANPEAEIVVAGCSVQIDPATFAALDPVARLVGARAPGLAYPVRADAGRAGPADPGGDRGGAAAPVVDRAAARR
jgi:threonylcarbamoyladenosine tRNA methylthiotransferase MtaB